MNFNKVLLAGNLTRDPEVRFLANEKAVGSFGLAVNRKFKDANGDVKEEVTFVDIECWGKTAEQAGQYLAKGKGCFIEGRLKMETWDDKTTGAKRSKLVLVADLIQFTGAPTGTRAGGGENARDETNLAPPAPRPPANVSRREGDAPPAARPAAAAGAKPVDDEPPF